MSAQIEDDLPPSVNCFPPDCRPPDSNWRNCCQFQNKFMDMGEGFTNTNKLSL